MENNKNNNEIKHSDGSGVVMTGEINSARQVFNVKSSGTKPYDTSNMLKPSTPRNQNDK